MATHNTQMLVGHKDAVLSLDVSADGRFLASSSKDKTVCVWMANADRSFSLVARCEGHVESVAAVGVNVSVCVNGVCMCVCVCVNSVCSFVV